MMSAKKSSLAGKISSLELQLKVLKGLLKKKKGKERKLSDLYGIVKDKGDFSYEEIKEAEVKIKEF
jgi:uncharacterized protein YfkK (UPF0435 family)